jgi:hypothetical protein
MRIKYVCRYARTVCIVLKAFIFLLQRRSSSIQRDRFLLAFTSMKSSGNTGTSRLGLTIEAAAAKAFLVQGNQVLNFNSPVVASGWGTTHDTMHHAGVLLGFILSRLRLLRTIISSIALLLLSSYHSRADI